MKKSWIAYTITMMGAMMTMHSTHGIAGQKQKNAKKIVASKNQKDSTTKNKFIFFLSTQPPSAIIQPMKLKNHQVTKAIVLLYEKEISALKMEIRMLKLKDKHGLLPYYQAALETIKK
jgi:hypothetical protein